MNQLIRILNTIDAAYAEEKQEAKEDAKQTAEAMKELAAKPTQIAQLNMGNGEQTLPSSDDIPLIPKQ